jgi:hypothetical protein
MARKSNRITSKTGLCFMCKNSDDLWQEPAEGLLATGSMIDYSDTYANGKHEGEYKKIVFRGYICDMHASSDDIVSIRYL